MIWRICLLEILQCFIGCRLARHIASVLEAAHQLMHSGKALLIAAFTELCKQFMQ
jgi:hypothetical protein